MKKLSYLFVALLAISLASCNDSETIPENSQEVVKLVGTSNYLSNLSKAANCVGTRSLPTEQDSVVAVIVDESLLFLESNGIDYKEFFENEKDPRIALFAMTLVELEKHGLYQGETRSSVSECAISAFGLEELVTQGLTKAVVKATAKAVLKKAIPYVGWGIFAVDMIYCLTED